MINNLEKIEYRWKLFSAITTVFEIREAVFKE